MQPIGAHGGEVMYFRRVFFRGELGFLNCDDICMCVVNKQFELLEFLLTIEPLLVPKNMNQILNTTHTAVDNMSMDSQRNNPVLDPSTMRKKHRA